MKTFATALLATLVASTALADTASKPSPAAASVTVKGDKARSLIRALKFAGVKATKKKSAWTYKVASITCHSTSGGALEDGIDQYDCAAGKLKSTGAVAAYLSDALGTVGIDADAGMSQTHSAANDVLCVDDQDATGGVDAVFNCSFKP
jgi:hypothetical protein